MARRPRRRGPRRPRHPARGRLRRQLKRQLRLARPGDHPGGRPVSTLGFTLFVGVMLATTALAVMVRILQERGLSPSPLGCTGIAASAVATVGLFVAASVATAVANGAGAGGIFRA